MAHPLRVSESIVPVSDFKARDSEWLRRVEEGLADANAGRVHSHAAVVAEMKKRFRQASPK
jgi:predicted transcriptional regulator